MNNKIIIGFLIIVLVIVVGVISNKTNDNKTIKIGALFMMTGPSAAFGEAQKRSAQMAVDEFNKSGGKDGKKAELVIQDTASDPKKTVDAYYALKNEDINIFIVEGSSMVSAVRKLIIDNGDFVITAGATTPTYYDNNNRSCRMTATAKTIGPQVADFMINKGYKRVSLLVPNNEYGKGVADELSKALAEKEADIVVVESYDSTGSGDYRTNITKIKSNQNDTDVLFAINVLSTVEPMFSQVRDLGWNKPIISDYNTLSNPALKNFSLLDGVEYIDWNYTPTLSTEDSQITKNFKTSFFGLFGQNPSLLDAGYYDSAKTLVNAIEIVGSDPQKIGDHISSLKNYQVVTGNISSFDSDCEASRMMTFRKIQDGKVITR